MKFLLLLVSLNVYAQADNPKPQPKAILDFFNKYKLPNNQAAPVVAPAANTKKPKVENEQTNLLEQARDSSVDMLINASAKYKTGEITKDQYIQIALEVSQMADYTKKVKASETSGVEVKAAVTATPATSTAATVTAAPAPAPAPKAMAMATAVTTAPAPTPTTTPAPVEAAPAPQTSPPITQEAVAKTVIDPTTKKVISCSKAEEKSGCKVGSYRSNMGSGGYYNVPDPVITLTKEHHYTTAGASINFGWTVKADASATCELQDVDSGKIVKQGFGAGSGSWSSPSIPAVNHSPAGTFMVICRYPTGQFAYNYAKVYHVKEGSPWLAK